MACSKFSLPVNIGTNSKKVFEYDMDGQYDQFYPTHKNVEKLLNALGITQRLAYLLMIDEFAPV